MLLIKFSHPLTCPVSDNESRGGSREVSVEPRLTQNVIFRNVESDKCLIPYVP